MSKNIIISLYGEIYVPRKSNKIIDRGKALFNRMKLEETMDKQICEKAKKKLSLYKKQWL